MAGWMRSMVDEQSGGKVGVWFVTHSWGWSLCGFLSRRLCTIKGGYNMFVCFDCCAYIS